MPKTLIKKDVHAFLILLTGSTLWLIENFNKKILFNINESHKILEINEYKRNNVYNLTILPILQNSSEYLNNNSNILQFNVTGFILEFNLTVSLKDQNSETSLALKIFQMDPEHVKIFCPSKC